MSTARVSGGKVLDGFILTDAAPTVTSEPVLLADAERKTVQVVSAKEATVDIEMSQDGPEGPFRAFVVGDVVNGANDPYFHLLTVVTAWYRVIVTKTEAGDGAVTADLVSDSSL